MGKDIFTEHDLNGNTQAFKRIIEPRLTGGHIEMTVSNSFAYDLISGERRFLYELEAMGVNIQLGRELVGTLVTRMSVTAMIVIAV